MKKETIELKPGTEVTVTVKDVEYEPTTEKGQELDDVIRVMKSHGILNACFRDNVLRVNV